MCKVIKLFPLFSEDLILFNPDFSPSSKELIITKLITNGIVSQIFGNLVSLESWNDAWIFKGLSKFLEYEINRNEAEFFADEMFISEVLHPTLQRQSFASDFPFSTDDALHRVVTEKGKKIEASPRSKVSMSLNLKYFLLLLFPAACTFRMIYHAIEREAFLQTLQSLIEAK